MVFPGGQYMGRKRLKIDRLLLDVDNPRITKASGQRDALQKIIEDQDSKLVGLAESIIDDGLAPMDRLLVVQSKAAEDRGKYIALEGNRRLAALKILRNINILKGLEIRSGLRKRFEELAATFDAKKVEPIECFEMQSRAAANPWIQQRHATTNDGRSIVKWNGVASARFRGRNPALQALDFVLAHGHLTEDERNKVLERFPITTLDRLLSTPAVRTAIGVEIDDGKLFSALPADEIIKPIKRFVLDLANKHVNVSKLKTRDQQMEYVTDLGPDTPNLSKRMAKSRPIDEIMENDFGKPKSDTKPKPKPKRKAKKSPRVTLIPKDVVLNITNAKIAEIEEELRTLLLAKHKHSIAVLFRVFLETSVDHFLNEHGLSTTYSTPGGTKDKSLNKKTKEAIDHLISLGEPKKHLDGISNGLNNPQSPLHVDTLHNYVHNRFYSPTEQELKVAWNNSQIFFEKIWP
jgi:hypothetical protein